MSLRTLTLAASTAALLVGAETHAATLSITGPGPSPSYVAFTGGVVTSTVGAQLINGNLIKIAGNATFVQPAVPVTEIRMSITGTFAIAAGETFILDYEFTGILDTLNPLGVSYSLNVDAVLTSPIPLAYPGVVSDQGVFEPGTSYKNEFKVADIDPAYFSFGSISGTFTASLVLDTSTLAPGESIQLQIPNNSIDLYAGVIPEPSGALLSGVALLGFAMRRRR